MWHSSFNSKIIEQDGIIISNHNRIRWEDYIRRKGQKKKGLIEDKWLILYWEKTNDIISLGKSLGKKKGNYTLEEKA